VRLAFWAMLAASVVGSAYGYTRMVAKGECPFATVHAGTGETQRSLSASVVSLRGAASETAEPHAHIFGIARKSITPDSVAAFGAPCVWEVPGAFARCGNSEASTVARFGERKQLVGWDSEHRFATVHEALADFSREAEALEASLGASHHRSGDPTDAGMSQPARQASLRYRFRDIAVDLTVTNLSNTFVVRRQVREIEDPS
jgi:hypothetical protein